MGGGAFFSTMGDWHNRTGRNQAEFDFETFPGMSFHVQYAAPLYRDEGRSKDVARSRDTIGYGGIRLEYMRISSRDVNTGARNANPSEMSKTDLTGHIVSLTVGGRGGGLHGGHFGIGPAIASFRAEETIMSQPTPTKIVTEATGFGLTLGTGYSLRLNRHLFWRVVGIDYYLFFGADLDLPDFGSNLGMVAIGSKITIVP